jgi:hypothetical protein
MPISRARFDAHVKEWQPKAGRNYWPNFLFHYADVTVVAAIVRERKLRCRSAQPRLICDVAEPGALAANPDAQNFVRLHFRPKNHFHLSTEGVKFRDDLYRRDTHMSIPVALMLDAGQVLTSAGVGFSGRKLAHIGEQACFDEAGFDQICFADVYHDGNPGVRGREINDRRTAEVIVPHELELDNCLKFIYCRSAYDEMTLRHLVGNDQDYALLKRVRVLTNPSELFFCWGTFLQFLDYTDRSIRLKLFQGKNYNRGRRIRCQIEQQTSTGATRNCDFEEVINNEGVQIAPFISDPKSIWKVEIEDCLAFQGPLPHRSSELVRPR